MTAPVLAFFNNKGGVGKTTLVYNLSHMYAELGVRVVVVDLDPKADLTAAFLDEDRMETLWETVPCFNTIYRAIRPLTEVGDVEEPLLESPARNLHLVPGDVALAGLEDALSEAWLRAMGDHDLHRPFRLLTAFWQAAQKAAARVQAELILFDVGPGLGALNRSALVASDWVVIPVGADLVSYHGLRNLGSVLRSWREGWAKRVANWTTPEFDLPRGTMQPLGYVVQQHMVRLKRPIKAYDRWVNRIPAAFREFVLKEVPGEQLTPENDLHCLARVRHYRSLVPLAQEARKPIFALRSADGAIGAHAAAVQDAHVDMEALAKKILEQMRR